LFRSAKTIHSKWTRHQAFEAEIQANKDRLFRVQQAGEELVKEKPELAERILSRIEDVSQRFEELEKTTSEKGERLFDANRQVLYEQTCDDIDSWMTDLERQIETDTGSDLASVNILMQKQQMIETQMAVKAKQVNELETQKTHLERMISPEKAEEYQAKKSFVEDRFERLQGPLLERKRELERKKEAFQFRRDVEDEKLWIAEKMPLAASTDYGNSLFRVLMLRKKNQSLKTEIDNHEPRIFMICDNGSKLINEGHECAEEFSHLIDELMSAWQELQAAVDARKLKLMDSEKGQQVRAFVFSLFF
jgi:spectrin beta